MPPLFIAKRCTRARVPVPSPLNINASQIVRTVSQSGREVNAHMNHCVTNMIGYTPMCRMCANSCGICCAVSASNTSDSCDNKSNDKRRSRRKEGRKGRKEGGKDGWKEGWDSAR